MKSQKVLLFKSLQDELSGRLRKIFSYDTYDFKVNDYLENNEMINDFKKRILY